MNRGRSWIGGWKGVAIVAVTAVAMVGPTAGCDESALPAGPGASSAAPGASPSAAAGGAAEPDGNADRSQIPPRYRWKLGPLYPSDEAFEQSLVEAAEARRRLGEFRGKLGDEAVLADCLALYFETRLLTNRLTLYANLRHDTNVKSSGLAGMNDRALGAMRAFMQAASFIRQELLALDDAAMAAAYAREPRLGEYRPYIDELRRRRTRVLGDEAERILAMAGDNLWAEVDLNELPSDIEKIYRALRADLELPIIEDEQGNEVPLSFANFGKYRGAKSRRVRRDAVEGVFAALRSYENAFAAALSGQIRFNVFSARARGYDTALEAYLDKDNIDPAVYRQLIEAIHANLEPLHRYVGLRKKAMGLGELHIYDLYAPLVEEATMQIPYDEAVALLPRALAPLGDDYRTVLRRGLDLEQGWVDVYPHKNKESGAFSASLYGVHPFVKMNYLGGVDDLSTLAHELGHALHSHLSMTQQPYVTAQYVPFIAEIASTLNEKLLSDYLLEQSQSDEQKLYLLSVLAETVRTTIYRQTLFAEFELAAHTAVEQGQPLTAELLNQSYQTLLAQYYGPELALGDNDAVEWAYVPHFFYKYYMFTYATGLASGLALAERVQESAEARHAYLGMLRGGSSKPPLELLQEAGVDLTKPEAIAAAGRLFDQTLEAMEALMAKRRK